MVDTASIPVSRESTVPQAPELSIQDCENFPGKGLECHSRLEKAT